MRLFFAALAVCLAGPVAAGEIMVMDPYARASRPGAPTGAVFMTLHNMGDTDDRLIGASTPVAQVTQIHTHIDDNGIMKMREIEGGLPVAAGQMHELARGGDHVMLMGVTKDLVQGETIPLTLIFENAGVITLDVPIDNKRGQGKAHKH